MPFKIFEVEDKNMSGTFFDHFYQFEKIWSISKNFISLGNLRIEFHFRN